MRLLLEATERRSGLELSRSQDSPRHRPRSCRRPRRALSRPLCLLILFLLVVVVFVIVELVRYLFFPRSSPTAAEAREVCRTVLNLGREFLVETPAGYARKSFSEVPEDAYFFVTDDQPLSDQEACSVESLVKAVKKKVYLVELLCRRPRKTDDAGGHNYAAFLGSLYGNLETVLMEGEDYFEGTPLEGAWKCESDMALLAARLLTVWRFGGAALSLDVLLNSEDLLAGRPAKVVALADQAISAPARCTTSLFFALSEVKEALLVRRSTREDVIRRAVADFREANPDNYSDVVILGGETICDRPAPSCALVKAEKVKSVCNFDGWLCEMSKYCRQIVKSFVFHKTSEEEVHRQRSKTDRSTKKSR